MDSNSHSNRNKYFMGISKTAFQTPDSGSVNIGLRLGFLNCETKGTVWFDNVKVEAVPSDYIYESEHIIACFETDDTQFATREGILNWLSELDKVYV